MRHYSIYIRRFTIWRQQHLSDRAFGILLSVLTGVLAALTAITLKFTVNSLHKLLHHDQVFDYTDYLGFVYPIIGIGFAVVLKKWVLRDSIKHNITSILHAISKRKSNMRKHKTFSSMMGGIFTSGFGGSIGLEAPIISSGSAIGSSIGQILRLDYKTRTLMLACGATGAVSAIFHTPITAVVFAVEVLLIDLTQFSLIPLLLSSVAGSLVSKILQNAELVFDYKRIESYDGDLIPYYFVFAILVGFIAVYFTEVFLFFEKKFEQINKGRKRLLYGGIFLGLLVLLLPPLYGEGFQTIRALLYGNETLIVRSSMLKPWYDEMWAIILFYSLLAFAKVIATSLTIGAGGIGGIFAPALFTGATSGFLFAYVLNQIKLFRELSTSNFTLVGMAAMLGSILHAPLTGVFLIAEITGGYMLMVPLMLTTTVSFITAKYIRPNSIITTQLAKKGELITHHKDKAVLSLMDMKSIIETDLFPIHHTAKLGELVKLISRSNRNIFPVINHEEHLVGIIYMDDVRKIMFKQELYEKVTVKDLMQIPTTIVYARDKMEQVMQKFHDSGAWNLPVLLNGKYIGFVSKSKIFMVYRKTLVDISSD